MLRLFVVLAALAATPAFATEWEHCSDAAGAASFDYLAGDGTGVLSINQITVTAGDRVWASSEATGPGDPVSVGQAFEDDAMILIDAMDKDFVKVAELRLFKAAEGDAIVYAGTLRIHGLGAWAVSCDGQ
jgi:hypothetical protein